MNYGLPPPVIPEATRFYESYPESILEPGFRLGGRNDTREGGCWAEIIIFYI